MTYTKAKLIIWNPDAYATAEVRAAAVWMFGCMNARREDLDQAALVIWQERPAQMTYASEEAVRNAQWNAAVESQRPSVLYRPSLTADGSMWCALYGDDLASGIAGFGKTPTEAMYEFDKAWKEQRTPAALYAARNRPASLGSERDQLKDAGRGHLIK